MDRGAWWATVNGVTRVRHDWASNICTIETYLKWFICWKYYLKKRRWGFPGGSVVKKLPAMKEKVKVKSLSHVWLLVTPWTVACQAPLSMGFSMQECQNGVPLPSPGDLLDPGTEPGSPALQADASPSEPPALLQCRRHGFNPWVRKILWRNNTNPLQYSCLEYPMDRGAWRVRHNLVTKTTTNNSNKRRNLFQVSQYICISKGIRVNGVIKALVGVALYLKKHPEALIPSAMDATLLGVGSLLMTKWRWGH